MVPHPDIYDGLSVDRSEIRLLDLSPGQFDDPIETNLSTISLDESLNFKALLLYLGRFRNATPY
jgi:hypothetical protein